MFFIKNIKIIREGKVLKKISHPKVSWPPRDCEPFATKCQMRKKTTLSAQNDIYTRNKCY